MFVPANIFQPLIDVFEAVLKFFHNSLGVPWGWSIVLLTVVVRAVLIPLTFKQFHSMQRLQAHMPEMKAIQAKYKDDKQRQQQEMMKFYKENQINPFGSCLPLVAQLPVFISLFYMLRQSLRSDICPQVQPHHLVNGKNVIDAAHTVPCGPHNGAGFLFIPDLTNHATGIVLVVLMVLYVVTQLGSSLLMASPTMDKRQRQMMLVLPLVFVFIIIGLPAGVIVYWITTNALMVAQQYGVKRVLGPATPVPAVDGAAAAGSKDGAQARPATKKGTAPARQEEKAAAAPADGNGAGGGLAGLFRGRSKDQEQQAVGAGTRGRSSTQARGGSQARNGPPPRPPRKKKKRSGRRR